MHIDFISALKACDPAGAATDIPPNSDEHSIWTKYLIFCKQMEFIVKIIKTSPWSYGENIEYGSVFKKKKKLHENSEFSVTAQVSLIKWFSVQWHNLSPSKTYGAVLGIK